MVTLLALVSAKGGYNVKRQVVLECLETRRGPPPYLSIHVGASMAALLQKQFETRIEL